MKLLLILISLLTLATSATSQSVLRVNLSGEQIYTQTCAACHTSGIAKAPKFGDLKAWTPLIAEGQHILTAHAWVGVRGMPAKGGRSDLTLEDFSKATAFMARASGAKWSDPDFKMLEKIRMEEQLRIKNLKVKK